MGLIFSAKCPCGVDTEVLAGSGMTPDGEQMPAWCKQCHRLVSAPITQAGARCSDCGSQADVISPRDAEPVPCPRCGALSLRFESVGLWD